MTIKKLRRRRQFFFPRMLGEHVGHNFSVLSPVGQVEVLPGAGGENDRVGQSGASRPVPGAVDHTLVGDLLDAHPGPQSDAAFAESVERPPAPGKRHLHSQRISLLENADLAPPFTEELGELRRA